MDLQITQGCFLLIIKRECPMKKIALSLLAIFAFISFSSIAFAATPASGNGIYSVKIEPLSAGIKAKSTIHGTDVAVINYSAYTINVNSPIYFQLTPSTSGRIISSAVQNPYIVMTDTSGREFFRNYVSNYATLSIYYSGGQYIVYVTDNP